MIWGWQPCLIIVNNVIVYWNVAKMYPEYAIGWICLTLVIGQ